MASGKPVDKYGTCAVCGTAFKKRHNRQKYCSSGCYDEAQRRKLGRRHMHGAVEVEGRNVAALISRSEIERARESWRVGMRLGHFGEITEKYRHFAMVGQGAARKCVQWVDLARGSFRCPG